jgi:hypothetical protein
MLWLIHTLAAQQRLNTALAITAYPSMHALPALALALGFLVTPQLSLASELHVLMEVKGRGCNLIPESREDFESALVSESDDGNISVKVWGTETDLCAIDPNSVKGHLESEHLFLTFSESCREHDPAKPLNYCSLMVHVLFTLEEITLIPRRVSINGMELPVLSKSDG